MAKQYVTFGAKPVGGTSPLAVRVGPCVFFSTLAGTNPKTDVLVRGAENLSDEARAFLTEGRHVDVMEWDVVAQTWGIFKNFEQGLQAFGGTLDNLVRTNTFFGHYYDFVAYEWTRGTFLKKAPPASAVMETGWRNADPRVRVIMHGWGTLSGGDLDFVKQPVAAHGVAIPGAAFSTAIQSGPLVWPSGQTGKLDNGNYVQHYSELPEDVPWLRTGRPHLDHREGRMSAQVWQAYENHRRIIGACGCTLDDILSETIYVKDLDYLPALDRVRRKLWPDPLKAPATTVVQVNDIGNRPLALLEVDIVALQPRNRYGWRREARLEADGLRSAVHGPVVTKAGPLRFVAGQHGVLDNGEPAKELGELEWEARSLHAGHLYAERPAEAQSWLVYSRLKRILESEGASLGDLAKVAAYFEDAGDIPAFESIGARALDGAMHATATVPVRRAGRTSNHVMVADAIAYVE